MVSRFYIACCVVVLAATVTALRIERSAAPPSHLTPVRASAPPATDTVASAITQDTPLPVGFSDRQPAPLRDPAAASYTQLVQGPMEEVLYADGGRAAPPAIVALALRLFGHTLDLTRDLALGDRVRLVVSNDTAGRATLDYAELDGARGPVRLYRVGPPGSGDEAYVDETGADLRRLLLRTPLAHPRLTSGFGFRLHPLLGYSRLHAGLDFGAAVGTPVLAAADGVVTRAGWAAGYGRLIVIAHGGGLETRYAHLSALSPGISPGARVAQGSAIGLSGQSGLATGPHLHFEMRRDGQPLDPATAVTLPAPAPTAAQTLALAERRREVEAVLGGDERPEPP